MIAFESEFDIGDELQHYVTKERFVVRFIVFGANGVVYQCYTPRCVGRPQDLYTFDEAELELIED